MILALENSNPSDTTKDGSVGVTEALISTKFDTDSILLFVEFE